MYKNVSNVEIDFNSLFNYFALLSNDKLIDSKFLENELIRDMGLYLYHRPNYVGGFGLRLWQYPYQFSRFINFLSGYSKFINSYLEIGVWYGGTFILMCEILRKLSVGFNRAVAVDVSIKDDNLGRYCELRDFSFRLNDSLSSEFRDYISGEFFDLVFIDGFHSLEAVSNDADLTRDRCNIQVFHDIKNFGCFDVMSFWEDYKVRHSSSHLFFEFYERDGTLSEFYGDLGIGVCVRKVWLK